MAGGVGERVLELMLYPALEQAVDAVVIFDETSTITFFNAAAERLWGYGRDEVLGCDAGRLISGWAPLAQERPGADGERTELMIERWDGSRVWGSLSLSRIEAGGRTLHMALVRDVTDEVLRRTQLDLLSLVADETGRVVIVTDERERIVYVNRAFSDIFGYAAAEAVGQHPVELLAGAYTNRRRLTRLRRRIGGRASVQEEVLAYDRNGNEIWVSAAVNAVRTKDGSVRNLIAVLSDVTRSKQIEALQHVIMAALADDKPIAEVIDLLCRRVEVIAPDVISSVLHVDPEGLLHPLAGPSLPDFYSQSLDGVAIGPEVGTCGTAAFRGEAVLTLDIERDPRWVAHKTAPLALGLRACWSTPIKARDGRVIGTFAFYFRQSRGPRRWHEAIVAACVHLCALAIERHEAHAQIARLAYSDVLTGLPNRAQLRRDVDRLLGVGLAAGHSAAFLFLDVDHFKDVNDTLGHSIGDELLVTIAQRLRSQLRPHDIVSRQGGDEFVIVLPDCDAVGASALARRVLEALLAPIRLGVSLLPVSASIGISLFPDHGRDADTLLKHADAAMYEAKRAGRHTYRFFSPVMVRATEDRLAGSVALRQALSNGQLKLHYQPQIRLDDGSLHGVEALARWRDPDLGEVPPSKFIALAEECGLIEPIGLWSLRESCRQIAAWRRAGIDVPCVSVNLSPVHFQGGDLAGTIGAILRTHDLPASCLVIEITEGVIMDQQARVVETMAAVRRLGVGLSMDDFGTGFSSLNRLATLPISELKIDRSFMTGVETEPSALAIATAIIRVGQSLGMAVVAEGVETEGQRRIMAELGCDVVQGFLYAPALKPWALEQWLVGRDSPRPPAWRDGLERRTASAGTEAVRVWPA